MLTLLLRSASLAALLLLAFEARAQQDPVPIANPGFEQGAVGSPPEGWRFTSSSGGEARLVGEGAFEGSQAVLVDATASVEAGRKFSNFLQSVDATELRGKRIRYRVAARVADLVDGSTVQLWCRVDRAKGEDGKRMSGAFDNMSDRPITDREWRQHDIVLDVAEDAERIVFGMFLMGNGRAWFDGASLGVVGADVELTAGASASTGTRTARAPAASAGDSPQNLKFEEGSDGGEVTGWKFTSNCGGTSRLTRTDVFEGRQAAFVDVGAPTAVERKFTDLSQYVDATAWRGQLVRLRAAVKVEALAGASTVQLWFRIDRAKDGDGKSQPGAFDNMGDRPIGNGDWRHFEIVLDVDADAERAVFGMFLVGQGKAWLDDVSVEVVGGSVAPATAAAPVSGSTSTRQGPEDPGFENGQTGARPSGWLFNSNCGGSAVVVDDGASEGERALLIDVSQPTLAGRQITNLTTSIDATSYRGKRIRYRAAVRTAGASGRVQMTMRVDRPVDEFGRSRRGGSDNMEDRPIRNEAWQDHDIVLDIDEDASRIWIGLRFLGSGKVWIDDVRFEVVGTDVPSTEGMSSRALRDVHLAPQQPFWTWWLVLPAVAIALFVAGMWPVQPRRPVQPPVEVRTVELGWLRFFALRFAIAYWLIYCLPRPFTSLLFGIARLCPGGEQGESGSEVLAAIGWGLSYAAGKLSKWHSDFEVWSSHFTAEHLFGIVGQLVPPRGSGDTTMGYMMVFNCFVLAFALAIAWTLLLRRFPSRDASVDLLRSYLRYILALAMLGYGLAKIRTTGNQFPEIGNYQMGRTWGDSSPMGVVWSFMGASRPYTVFAGLGELCGAALLIWRHTALLGALVSIGVMTNVVMLNYCYDVPVKIYSTHLLVMGLLVVVPDAQRLISLFLLHRNPIDIGTPTVWHGKVLPWVRWLPKLTVLVVLFAIPLWDAGKAIYGDWTKDEAPKASADGKYRLVKERGFRWINEVPYNR